MGVLDGCAILRPARGWIGLWLCIVGLALQGCGLVFDAVRYVWPLATDEVDAICVRGRLRVGMAVEPFRPFVFPATWTDEGAKVTGLDVELVQEIAGALSRTCGDRPVRPVVSLVRFRDLFVELHEGKLDLFVSAVTANLPAPARAGLAYSIPYFMDGGLSALVREEQADARLRAALGAPRVTGARLDGVAGLTIAVQEGTAAHLYAESTLRGVRLLVCDSLPAAFESDDPRPDVILGSYPILDFMARRVRPGWRLVQTEGGGVLLLSRGHYAVVLAEETYRLRMTVDDVLFRLWQSGRLEAMRRRWLLDEYAYPRRAAAEGLPFTAEQVLQHYDQGRCRMDAS
ncbi:substrate-binding periplasmic protein [Candidatus Nitrospira bockiana]